MIKIFQLGLTLFFFGQSTIFADFWNGETYASHSSVQMSHADRLLNELQFSPGDQVLDLGCGDGKVTAKIAKRLPKGEVIGIDPSDSMLKKAKNAFPHLCLMNGRAEDFSLSNSFDHIIAIHVMHWVKDQKKALTNIYNHLAPGGQVHLILAPSKEGLPFFDALQTTIQLYADDFASFENPQQVYDIETYRKLLVDAGFHINELQYIYHESIHENRDHLQTWIEQWLPHGKHLQEPKRSAFFEDLMNRYPDPTRWGEYVLIIRACK